MRSVKCDALALLACGLLLPALALANDISPSAMASENAGTFSFGPSVAQDTLEQYRGGSIMKSEAISNGLLQDATAVNVATGNNSITDGAFAHAVGLPIVIQNSGANVLIQNSTIVNVQFR